MNNLFNSIMIDKLEDNDQKINNIFNEAIVTAPLN